MTDVSLPAPSPVLPSERAAASSGTPMWSRILHVGWMSVLLGITIELLLLALATTRGIPKLAPVVADLAQKVSWATIVCAGLAIGNTAGRRRSDRMGLLGLISAPVGFHVARATHKGVGQALGLVAGAAVGSTFVVAGLKALEYGILGATVGGLGNRGGKPNLRVHLLTGAVVGIVFGSAIIAVAVRAAPQAPTAVDLVAKAINELIFPVGCSFVLWAAEALGSKVKE
ncbi:MAG TPA: hypothetical protein VFS60_16735 [Thermoanaerobaculia bacterium]|nr:hypothetical protein [Thermoanaerobaculia bacterium]